MQENTVEISEHGSFSPHFTPSYSHQIGITTASKMWAISWIKTKGSVLKESGITTKENYCVLFSQPYLVRRWSRVPLGSLYQFSETWQ